MRPSVVALAAFLVVSCTSDDSTVRSESDDGQRSTTTCVTAPATTAMGMKGGGEIVCGPAEQSTDETPPTTIPQDDGY